MAIITAKDFVEKLKYVEKRHTLYSNSFPWNCGYFDGYYIYFDCWNLGKSIIWDPLVVYNTENGTHANNLGGNGMSDTTIVGIFNECATYRSRDFGELIDKNVIGAWIRINDTHAGYYVGDGMVIESTPIWENGVQYTKIDRYGNRYSADEYGSQSGGQWTEWAMIKQIKYEDTPQPEPEPTPTPTTKKKGIDVSRHQGTINWDAVKSSVDFAIIKAAGHEASEGYYTDRKFEENYKNAKKAGVPIGCYYYNGPDFCTAEVGRKEAEHFIEVIKGKQFEYPVCADIEEVLPSRGKSGITEAAIAFCETMEKAGYYVSIYSADVAGFDMMLDWNKLTAYDKWIAFWSENEPKHKPYGMWQYNCHGVVNGIGGQVDLDYAFKDYPIIIKNAKLNGYGDTPEPTPQPEPIQKKTVEEIAQEVIDGKWGNGEERKKKLEEAGYNYREVQDKVNEMCKKKSYVVGTKVKLTGVYTASTSAKKLTPAIKDGVIKTVMTDNCRNPYLIYSLDNKVIGWANRDCME